MYMKSLVSLAVLGAMSAVATAGDHVVFDNPNESYTVDRLSKYGATIKASDITITNTTYNHHEHHIQRHRRLWRLRPERSQRHQHPGRHERHLHAD